MQPIGYDRRRASEILQKSGIDVLVASSDVNVFYTTGLPTLHVSNNPILWVLKKQYPYLALIRSDGEISLFYWMVFASLERFSWVKDAAGIISPEQAVRGVCDKLSEWGIGTGKTIGLESLMPRYQSEQLMREFSGARFVDGDPAFLKMRLVKSAEEIRRIKKSTEISETAIESMMASAHEGTADTELLRTARRTIIDEGAEGWDHLTIGIGPSDPEAPGSGATMKRGEITRLDVGAVWQGYVSDISREVALASVPEGAEGAMERLIAVQDFCADHIRPGVAPKDVYAGAMDFHKGMRKAVKPIITCHSMGLECEELHLFSRMSSADILFEENMLLDIEVWQSFRDSGLLGIEDVYHVTSSACKQVTTLDKEIFLKRG